MTHLLLLLAPLVLAGCGTATIDDNDSTAEDCTDGLDNDGNGQADCADPACADLPICDEDEGDGGGTEDDGGSETGDGGSGDGGGTASPGDLYINELMASNQTTIADEGGAWADWFELYNPGSSDLSLAGWTVSDDLDEPDKHQLDSVLSVPAGGFLLLWADDDEEQGPNHVGFNLDADGEELAIYDAAGTRIDAVTFEAQVTDVSAARRPDGGSSWVLADPATPGTSNGAAR